MKPFIVKLVSKGDFEKISIEMRDWLTRFPSLISQRIGIKYNVYEMPTLSAEIQKLLVQRNLDNGHATDKLDSWPPND